MIHHVVITRWAQKQLIKVPTYIASKLKLWVHTVELQGLED